MIKKILIFSFIILSIASYSQKKEEVLFTIDKEPVYTSEFMRVYAKNKNLIIDDNQKDVDAYLKMFIDFKLKVKQAYDKKLDENPAFKEELLKYREQLIAPYMGNKEVTENLVREAYDRTVNEVNVSHILIKISQSSKPNDTLLAFQEITKAYNKAKSGIPFKHVAKEYSQDPSVTKNEGNLGYFTAFSMVYPFENTAFTTNVGEISNPFRTQFGYHIIKVNDKRPSKGEIQVAHIFVKNISEDSTYASSQINEIYQKIQQGEDFAFLAKNYSEDKSSAQKGGEMQRFGTGRLIMPLENAAFSLKNVGDVSKPFSTVYGWHIFKLLQEYPVADYDILKENLKQKINNGNRAVVLNTAFAEQLKNQYKVVENDDNLVQLFLNTISENTPDMVLFTIENQSYTFYQYKDYLNTNSKKSSKESYINFKSGKIIDYHKDHLEETNKEFAETINEYTDGLLLFDLLQKSIWDKAEKDSIGLENYFKKNIKNYQWKLRADVVFANCTKSEKANLVRNYLVEGKNTEQIKELVNEGATIHVLFSRNVVEENSAKLPKGFELNRGVSPVYKEDDTHYTVLDVKNIIPAGAKEMDEIRGQVLNDYQNYLEEQWVIELRNQYDVKINKRALKHLKKELNE